MGFWLVTLITWSGWSGFIFHSILSRQQMYKVATMFMGFSFYSMFQNYFLLHFRLPGYYKLNCLVVGLITPETVYLQPRKIDQQI